MISRRLPLFLSLSIPTLLTMGALAGGCSSDDTTNLPYFEGGIGEGGAFDGGGGDSASDGGGDEASTEAGPSDSGPKSDAASDGSVADSGDGGPPAGGLVISQVQTRGTNGAGDEFIEVYNPTTSSITFDLTWSIKTRPATSAGCAALTSTNLVTGTGQVIPSHKHALFAASGFDQGTMSDGTISNSMSDGASVVLYHGLSVADALCFSAKNDSTTLTTLTTCANPYTCEGTPITNVHDNGTGTNQDSSLERKPGGTGGNATDTNDSSNDFAAQTTSDPHNIAAAAVP
ncbi:MAG TPA: hypothetical protein VF407_04630 [Polyangiaceae bacterium]